MTAHGIDLASPVIRNFCRKWKVRELSVFGSILRDDFGRDSDIDFLVDYEEVAEWDLFDHMDMRDELAAIVGREVDLLTRRGVEASKNRFLKREILSHLERVYAAG